MSDDGSNEPKKSSTVLCKRPLFVLQKAYNEIYITSRAPLCVYFERALHLLRWQLSRFPDLCSDRFVEDNRLNRKTGVLGNRSKLLAQHGAHGKPAADPRAVSAALSKRNEAPPEDTGDGVVLCGTGRCVTRALYVLHDIYEHVKELYVEARLRFRRGPLRVPCADCAAPREPASEARAKHALSERCAACESRTNEALEAAVKRILLVDICTDTVACRDDVYRYSVQGAAPTFVGQFDPLAATNTSLTLSEQERFVSSIRIFIRVAGT
ncbi:ubiquitin- ligase e3 component, putative [Babesia caballi]|uniref:Ubiquitin- ligase e3 component, putative n=1 Tax=Babesia caballi TaxID=5871 RepID=A0AAV4LRB4_BABCB|nr:ubiquitin- ligase e3 component, putative [Babesia caballi]